MSLAVTLLPSAARTATPAAVDIDTQAAVGLLVTVDITNAGTGSLTVTIDRKDVISGKYSNILTSAALAANATTLLRVYPLMTAAANVTANDFLSQVIRITVTHANGNSITYSVGYDLIKG